MLSNLVYVWVFINVPNSNVIPVIIRIFQLHLYRFNDSFQITILSCRDDNLHYHWTHIWSGDHMWWCSATAVLTVLVQWGTPSSLWVTIQTYAVYMCMSRSRIETQQTIHITLSSFYNVCTVFAYSSWNSFILFNRYAASDSNKRCQSSRKPLRQDCC